MKTITYTLTLATTLTIFMFSAQLARAGSPANAQHNVAPIMKVYKSPTCGCCAKWIDHVTENGIKTNVVEMNNVSPIKTKYNIEGRYRSCHTGVVTTVVGEYIFEGHVPAEHVNAFLKNPPEGAIGLAVPGMPIGSPGMEVGDRKDYYQILLLAGDGSHSVFAHVNKPESP